MALDNFPLTNLAQRHALATALRDDYKPIRFTNGWGYTKHSEQRIELINTYLCGHKALWEQIKPLITYRHLVKVGLVK